MRGPVAALLAALSAALPAAPPPAVQGWGRDINPGAGPKVLEEARPGLLAILRAAPADREARIAEFAAKAGPVAEAWKRFRNPELKPLFLRLLEDPDWRTVHRALLALESYGGDDVLQAAWKHLFHAERRLREKAAITCIRTWSARGAKGCSRGDWKGALAALLDTEPDPHVRKCLEALELRTQGRLAVQEVHEEFVLRDADGLLWTPFLSGMDAARRVAPGWTAKGFSQGGGPSALKTPVADAWTTPLLGLGEEVVPGTSLQPFANPRENGVVHTGLDVGACLDGAGYYAAADGVVKLVHAGSDMGTLLVLEHRVEEARLACAVYMHGGGTVFVKGGDRVEAGRLLGTMGLGFSLENGGHYAHLHYGLYPGPFDGRHNYGYKKAADGLWDWHDPARCLPLWRDRGAVRPGEAPAALLERATRVRRAGYPARARVLLREGQKVLKGAGGVEALGAALEAWEGEPSFREALKAEPRVEALEAAVEKALSMPDPGPWMRRTLQAAFDEVRETEVAPRVRALAHGDFLR